MNEKAPAGSFLDGRLFLQGKSFVREPAAATPQFSSKTTEFEKFYYKTLKFLYIKNFNKNKFCNKYSAG